MRESRASTESLVVGLREHVRHVKDRVTGGEVAAYVVSPLYSTFCRKFRGCNESDVHGLKGLWLAAKNLSGRRRCVCSVASKLYRSSTACACCGSECFRNSPIVCFNCQRCALWCSHLAFLKRSLDVCDVLTGNINGESRSSADLVTSGVRESAVAFDDESVS